MLRRSARLEQKKIEFQLRWEQWFEHQKQLQNWNKKVKQSSSPRKLKGKMKGSSVDKHHKSSALSAGIAHHGSEVTYQKRKTDKSSSVKTSLETFKSWEHGLEGTEAMQEKKKPYKHDMGICSASKQMHRRVCSQHTCPVSYDSGSPVLQSSDYNTADSTCQKQSYDKSVAGSSTQTSNTLQTLCSASVHNVCAVLQVPGDENTVMQNCSTHSSDSGSHQPSTMHNMSRKCAKICKPIILVQKLQGYSHSEHPVHVTSPSLSSLKWLQGDCSPCESRQSATQKLPQKPVVSKETCNGKAESSGIKRKRGRPRKNRILTSSQGQSLNHNLTKADSRQNRVEQRTVKIPLQSGRQKKKAANYRCSYCRFYTNDKAVKDEHYKLCHPYRCPHCKHHYPTLEQFETHREECEVATYHQCFICQKKFHRSHRKKHFHSRMHSLIVQSLRNIAEKMQHLSSLDRFLLSMTCDLSTKCPICHPPLLTVEQDNTTTANNHCGTSLDSIQYLLPSSSDHQGIVPCHRYQTDFCGKQLRTGINPGFVHETLTTVCTANHNCVISPVLQGTVSSYNTHCCMRVGKQQAVSSIVPHQDEINSLNESSIKEKVSPSVSNSFQFHTCSQICPTVQTTLTADEDTSTLMDLLELLHEHNLNITDLEEETTDDLNVLCGELEGTGDDAQIQMSSDTSLPALFSLEDSYAVGGPVHDEADIPSSHRVRSALTCLISSDCLGSAEMRVAMSAGTESCSTLIAPLNPQTIMNDPSKLQLSFCHLDTSCSTTNSADYNRTECVLNYWEKNPHVSGKADCLSSISIISPEIMKSSHSGKISQTENFQTEYESLCDSFFSAAYNKVEDLGAATRKKIGSNQILQECTDPSVSGDNQTVQSKDVSSASKTDTNHQVEMMSNEGSTRACNSKITDAVTVDNQFGIKSTLSPFSLCNLGLPSYGQYYLGSKTEMECSGWDTCNDHFAYCGKDLCVKTPSDIWSVVSLNNVYSRTTLSVSVQNFSCLDAHLPDRAIASHEKDSPVLCRDTPNVLCASRNQSALTSSGYTLLGTKSSSCRPSLALFPKTSAKSVENDWKNLVPRCEAVDTSVSMPVVNGKVDDSGLSCSALPVSDRQVNSVISCFKPVCQSSETKPAFQSTSGLKNSVEMTAQFET